MEPNGAEKIAPYLKEWEYEAPTAVRVFEVFGTLQRHVLRKGGKNRPICEKKLTKLF